MIDERCPKAIDWYLFIARWPLFASVLLVYLLVPLANTKPQILYATLLIGATLNLVCLLLLVSKQYTSFVSGLAQLIDIVVILAILYATGQGNSPLFVLAAIPVVGGTLRFGRAVGFATALVLTVGYGAMILLPSTQTPPQEILVLGGLIALVLFLLAGVPSGHKGMTPRTATGGRSSGTGPQTEAHERLRSMYELTSLLSTTLSYERVLDALLDASDIGLEGLGGTDSPSVRMVFLYSSGSAMHVAAARNLLEADRGLTIGAESGLVQQALMTAEPAIGNSATDDPELTNFASLTKAQSLLCVPLRAGFEVYGVVLVASPRANAYTKEHVELVTAFCNQAVIALQNARLYQIVQADKERIINTQEDIRRQLAHELHDGPTQAVSAIAMRLNFTKMLVTRDPERTIAELEKLEELARKTAREIRTMLFTLRPLVLETQGLAVALEQYADKLNEAEELSVHIDSDLLERLAPTTEGIAFSIIEEAVNNAKKHARANNIDVRLRLQQDLFVAEVKDDGRGFDLSSVDRDYDQRGSLGLVNMRERAALVSGSLTINSELGQGTVVTLLIPLSDADLAAR
jgi:signal transduction histidine kinase